MYQEAPPDHPGGGSGWPVAATADITHTHQLVDGDAAALQLERAEGAETAQAEWLSGQWSCCAWAREGPPALDTQARTSFLGQSSHGPDYGFNCIKM